MINNKGDKFGIYYHVFADNLDYYEDNLKKANERYNSLKKDGQENIRLYQCWYDSKEAAESFDDCSEGDDCLRSKGEFPL